MSSFQDIKNASLYEPRIEFIKKQLDSLLSVIDLEKDGEVVEVDSFRLKNLRHWVSPSPCDPIEVFGYAGTRCDCACLFCCNRGNPPSSALGNLRRPPGEEFEEMRTRMNYFFPRAGTCLFPSLGDIYEVMLHPHFLEVLRLLREKTSKVFRITTNGKTLTPEAISQLAELKPIYLYISLNSVSHARRRRLMKDKNPQIAIQSLPLLKDAGIPYSVVIVPWPLGSLAEMLDDLSSTVAHADLNDCHLVEINLPGYTRYFSPEKLYDLDDVWSRTVSCVRTLREKTGSPIVVMPSMYEENLYEGRKNLPEIIGLVKNSPAAMSGLNKGDLILKIGGITIASRPQARDLLSVLQRSENREASLTVERDGHALELSLNLEVFSYPYSRETDNHPGIIFMGTGLRMSYLEGLKEIIDSHKAKHVLFLSSTLVKPTFEQCLAESHLFGDRELRIDVEVPRNNFFGGDVFMGDLLVVQDFIDFIKEYLEGKERPDLIVIPSSPFNLGGWGRDLTGRVYLDIGREVGIPVELLECSTIFD
ncbi:MAG: radical SAM protein [Dehalococcoidia bacterium]|nr:radical SAM protein [Dehalococcoidia bacterium]